MPRPRYSKDDKTALDKMEDAFWECMEEGPYGKITVSAIVRKARVNRNTFYYHYQDIDDMARRIVQERTLDQTFAQIVLAQVAGGSFGPASMFAAPGFQQRFHHLCLVVGDNGTPELQRILRKGFVRVWSEAFSIEYDSLDAADKILLEFTLGGLLSVLAFRAGDGFAISPELLHDPRLEALAQQNISRLFSIAGGRQGAAPALEASKCLTTGAAGSSTW